MKQYLDRKKIAVGLRRWLLMLTLNSKIDFEALTGTTRERFLEYLQAQFTPEMSWFNYGKVWNLDHIVPTSILDQFSQEEKFLCWHYLNTRPTTVKTNKSKSASILESMHELDQRLKFLPNNQVLLDLRKICVRELEKQGEVDYSFLVRFT